MKCLIIAAGKGSRLTQQGNTKSLIPVLGIPLIERVVRSAMEAGINDFFVVSGYNGDKLRNFLDGMVDRCPVGITHVINDEWEEGNGLSVLKAREQLNEPFLLLMTDHMFDPVIVRKLIGLPLREGEVTLAVDFNTANPLVDMEDVTRVWRENGKVKDIGKGLTVFNGFDTGIYICTTGMFDALECSMRGNGDNSLSGGARWLAHANRVNAHDIGARFWLDVDDPKALNRVEGVLLERICVKATDGPVSRFFNRPVSVRISRYLTRFSITPNDLSLVSFLSSLIAAGLLAIGSYDALALGGLLAQFASIVDGCDGEIARLKFQESSFGGWFDAVLDRYADAFLLFGLTWHVHSAGPTGLAIGFLAIIGSFMVSYTADKYDRRFHVRTSHGRFRIGRDVRVFLIFIGSLLNQPLPTLVIIAILMNGEVIRRIVICRDKP